MHDSQGAGSPIPPALLQSPRTVFRKPGTLVPLLIGRIISTPFILSAAALLAFSIFEPVVVFLIPAQPAHIINQSRDLQAHGGTAYFIDYQFDRSHFTARDEVLPNEYETFQLNQPIQAHVIHLGPIGYSALDRSPKSYARYRLILWFATLFIAAIAIVFLQATWLTPRRAHWLTQHGQPTFGAVVAKNILRTLRRDLSYTLTYQFKANGNLHATRIRISPQRYDSADVKDLVIILFDPKNPARNIVYDYSDYFAA